MCTSWQRLRPRTVAELHTPTARQFATKPHDDRQLCAQRTHHPGDTRCAQTTPDAINRTQLPAPRQRPALAQHHHPPHRTRRSGKRMRRRFQKPGQTGHRHPAAAHDRVARNQLCSTRAEHGLRYTGACSGSPRPTPAVRSGIAQRAAARPTMEQVWVHAWPETCCALRDRATRYRTPHRMRPITRTEHMSARPRSLSSDCPRTPVPKSSGAIRCGCVEAK